MDSKTQQMNEVNDSVQQILSELVMELNIATEMADKYEQIRKEKEQNLMDVMKECGIEQFEVGDTVVEHQVPGYGMRLNGELLKEEAPDVYLAYSVPVPIKEKISIRKR